MAQPQQRPWAILLCKWKDDPNDPAVTTVRELAAQWRVTKDATFVAANLTPAWDNDSRTLLELCQNFFTTTGIFTPNIVDYFDNMSHGLFEMFGNQVFPITLDLTIAEGATLAATPGSNYQNSIFQQAKKILKDTYNVDWHDFYGVAVSFQSAEGGGEGGVYDGGPGAWTDIRYTVNNGTQEWGHEIGHGFGLGHSRTDGQLTSQCTGGAPSDYTDPFDIMSINCALTATEPTYGMMGPGMNAWNMRHMQGLDESRIWKSPSNVSFSQTLTVNPLHQRYKIGYLGAELPGIGGHSSYLVEFRVPSLWDSAFPQPVVVVHRFQAPNSYVMKGTKGQKGLRAGDTFIAGSGPFSKVTVRAIDPVTETATIDLCFDENPYVAPTAKIEYDRNGFFPCEPRVPIEETVAIFTVKLMGGTCSTSYATLWSVSGGSAVAGQSYSGATFSVLMPKSSQLVVVRVELILEDGSTLHGEYSFHPLDASSANLQQFLCQMSFERLRPIPWWEWDPEKLRNIARDYSRKEWEDIRHSAAQLSRLLAKSGHSK